MQQHSLLHTVKWTFLILHKSPETKRLLPSFSNIIAINLYSCIRAVETTLKCFTKAIGWKVSQHVVPAAVIGHAPLSSLPSDSKEPCSLTWAVPTFTALFHGLPHSAILFPVEEKEVLLPAAVPSTVNWRAFAGTHTHTHIHSWQRRPPHVLFLFPAIQFRMPLPLL